MPTLEETRYAAPAPETAGEAEKGKKKAKPTKAPKAAKPRGRMPTKRSINLATVNVKRINWLIAVPSIILVLAACAAFAKFAVVDRFIELSRARAEVARLQSELDANRTLMESYGDLNDLYAHYTISGMTEEELGRVDRVTVMELLRRDVLPRVQVDSWSVRENVLTMSVSGRTLQDVNLLMQQLLQDDMVDYCTVSTAEMSQDRAQAPAPASPDEAPEVNETVAANVIVTLKNAEQEAKIG